MKTFHYLYINIPKFIRYCIILAPTIVFVLILVDIKRIPIDFRGTDDGSQFIVRNLALSEFLNSSIMYPRWLSGLYYGYGYPVLQFYSPFIYILIHIIRSVGLKSLDDAFLMLCLIITCCAFIGAMRFSSRLQHLLLVINRNNNKTYGEYIHLVPALIYVNAPYPFIINILLRGAFPEALALAMLPWLATRMLIMYRNETTQRSQIIINSILLTTIMMIHQLSYTIFVIVISGIGVFYAFVSKVSKVYYIFIFICLSINIGGLFWIPIIFEASQVRLSVTQKPIAEFDNYLLDTNDVIQKPWPYNYGWNSNEINNHTNNCPSIFISCRPNETRLITSSFTPIAPSWTQIIGIVSLIVWFMASRFSVRNRKTHPVIFLAITIIGVIVWLMTGYSSWLWKAIKVSTYIQFPWRLLGILAFLSLVLFSAKYTTDRRNMVMLIGSFYCLIYMYDSYASIAIPTGWRLIQKTDRERFITEDYAYDRPGASTGTVDGEFTPRGVDIRRPDGSLGGAVRLDRLAPPGAWVAGLAMVQAGDGYVSSVHGDATRLRAVVDAGDAGVTLAIHQLDFPGWRATVDGARVAVHAATEVPGSGVTPGWLTIAVPAGRHEVAVWFGATWPRLLGDGVTCVTLALMGFALVREWRGGVSRPVGTTLVVAGLLVVATWNLGAEALTIRAPAATSPVTERVVLDVVEAVRRGDALMQSPSGARLGPDAFLDAGWLDVRPPSGRPVQVGTGRRWLYMHPPSRASVRVRVPAGGAILQSGIAIRPDAWEVPEGDGVHFVVEVAPTDGIGGSRTALFQRVNPRAHLDERRWIEVRADLGEWAGRDIDLVLRTEPVDTVAYDWAGWGNPMVVVPAGILRPANGPQPPASVSAPRTWMVDQ